MTTRESAHSRAWWPPSLYPLAVPISFIVVVWMATQIHPIWLVRPILVVAAGLFLLTVALSALLGDRDRGALAAFVVGVALVVNDVRISGLLLLVAALIFVEGLINRGRPWRFGSQIGRFLSALGMALVVVVLVTLVQQGALPRAIDDVAGDLGRPVVAERPESDAPDIWVILLDGYPGDAAARHLAPDFDRDAFPRALEERGFAVQRDSHPNYLATHLALPAFFNGRYVADLPSLGPPYGATPENERRLRRATEASPLFGVLADEGYETTSVVAGWSQLGGRRVDRLIVGPEVNEFELLLAGNTAVGQVLDALHPDFASAEARARIEDAFAAAERISTERSDRPRFTFVHVPSPHLPYVYGPDGEPMSGGPETRVGQRSGLELERDDRIKRTFDQVEYIGDRTIVALDRILAASAEPPVVVIWSDHGTDVDWILGDPLSAGLTERTSNFLALLAPGHPGLFRAGTTPVNILPQVFNEYLGTDLPLQEDRTFGWQGGTPSLVAVPLVIP